MLPSHMDKIIELNGAELKIVQNAERFGMIC